MCNNIDVVIVKKKKKNWCIKKIFNDFLKQKLLS